MTPTAIVIVTFLLAVGLKMIQMYFKLMLKLQKQTHQTTLLGGRWRVGENGVLAFHLLRAIATYGILVVLASCVAGWISIEAGVRALLGMALANVSLSMVR